MRATGTLTIFGAYLLALGFAGMLIPNVLLRALHMPETREVWVRIAGMLVSNFGVLYFWIVRTGSMEVARCTVLMRILACGYMTAFVVAGLVQPTLLIFAALDGAGGLWTEWALRRDARAGLSGTRDEVATR